MKTTPKTQEQKFMSEAYIAFRHHLEDFSDAQQSKLATLFANYVPQDMLPAKGEELSESDREGLKYYIADKLFGDLDGKSIVDYTMGELLDSQETVVQRDVLPGKVYAVLADPEYGLLCGQGLIKPPMIGEILDENGDVEALVVEGARHRLSAIVTIFAEFGFSEEDILDIEVPCISLVSNSKRIIADNKSRGCTKYEEIGVNLSTHGIDVRNPLAVWQAYLNGQVPGTTTKQRSDAVRLVFILTTNDDDTGLTEETRGMVATALLGTLKEVFTKDHKVMLNDNHFITRLLEYAKHDLKNAIRIAREQVGVTNMARAYKTLASIIVQHLKITLTSKTLPDGTPFEISVPKPVEKVTAVNKVPTTTAKRTTKATAKEQNVSKEAVEGKKATKKAVPKKEASVDKPTPVEV